MSKTKSFNRMKRQFCQSALLNATSQTDDSGCWQYTPTGDEKYPANEVPLCIQQAIANGAKVLYDGRNDSEALTPNVEVRGSRSA